MPKTFAQFLVDSILPKGMHITKQIDKKYMEELLGSVAKQHPDMYGRVVSDLKRLGDKISTLDPLTIGMEEILTPNKANRDKIIAKHIDLVNSSKDKDTTLKHLEGLQKALASNDLHNAKDDASTMLHAALGGKKAQMMKARTSPGVVKDYKGEISPEIFTKSYAEGIDPVHFWLGAAESRSNIAEGQVSTSAPGELGKVIANVMNSAVVSTHDCGTKAGITLMSKDDDIIGRFLAIGVAGIARNTVITEDIQKKLLADGIVKVVVRSPQTCQAPATSVCQKCMGLRNSTGKLYAIGDNAGMISAGTLSEPLTQMTLSAKHSTSLATVEDVNTLKGEKGFRKFTTMPKNYSNRKMFCEIYGKVFRIMPAPQGGKIITITVDVSKPVPQRYIEHAAPTPNFKNHVDYFIPPNLKITEGLDKGSEVYPGLALSNGIENLQDVARLRNLGALRASAAQGIYDIYKNTGNKMSRVHMELLARQSNPYVKLEKVPANFPFNRGEVVEYNRFVSDIASVPKQRVSVASATGKVLGTAVLDLTVGTELDGQNIQVLKDNKIQNVEVIDGLEISAVAMPMTRVVNKTEDWISALNHRNLKDQIKDAATTGKVSDIHGYKPIAAYAYGSELMHGEGGKY